MVSTYKKIKSYIKIKPYLLKRLDFFFTEYLFLKNYFQLDIFYLYNFLDNLDLVFNGEVIDYKNIVLLRNFINIQGKILPRRLTKVTAKQHRYITKSF